MDSAPESEITVEAAADVVRPETPDEADAGEVDAAAAPDAPAEAVEEPAPPAVTAGSDAACFRSLLDALGPEAADGPLALVADEIRQALDLDLESETLLDRLTEALADDGADDDELTLAAPTLAVLAVRSLLRRLGPHTPEPDTSTPDRLVATATETVQRLIETGISGAVRALPGIVAHLAGRAARDRLAGSALIPALRRIAERVAYDPDLVRRLSGRGSLSRPLATAAYGAAAFRQQPVRCRIDGPVEIIIVRR
jgi:hypothetical protein